MVLVNLELLGERGREGLPRGTRKLQGVMDRFIIFIVALVIWVCMYART